MSRERPRFSEDWLVAVLDSLSEGVVALDGDGRILAANPAAERLLGFAIAQCRYEPWDRLSWRELVDEDGTLLVKTDHPVVATLADRREREATVVGLPGERIRWLGLATHVLPPSEQDLPGVVVSFQDRTWRVESEHERQRLLTLMREFMMSVAHDLRGPLVTIAGWTDVLQHDWSDLQEKERMDALTGIRQQVGLLGRLVDDLSVVGRLESGGVSIDTGVVAVADLVEHALGGLVEGSRFDVDVPGDVLVEVDPDHGRRMLLNLAENAIKYGEEPFRISLAVGDHRVEIAVSDGGPGVPPEFRPHLFERFTRSSSSRGSSGTGLGLAIVAGLAQLNGGSVDYHPPADGGARFVLSLPRPDDTGTSAARAKDR